MENDILIFWDRFVLLPISLHDPYSFFTILGIAMAMDTIVSQAYGAKNFKLIGITFQNAIVVASALSVPISILWWFSEPILVGLWQDPALSRGAGIYNKLSIPGLIPLMYFRTISQYLQNQRIMYPAVIAGGTGIALSIPLNYILIFGVGSWKGLGLTGASIAGSLTHFIMCTVLWTYVTCRGINKPTCDKCLWKEYVLVSMYDRIYKELTM